MPTARPMNVSMFTTKKLSGEIWPTSAARARRDDDREHREHDGHERRDHRAEHGEQDQERDRDADRLARLQVALGELGEVPAQCRVGPSRARGTRRGPSGAVDGEHTGRCACARGRSALPGMLSGDQACCAGRWTPAPARVVS